MNEGSLSKLRSTLVSQSTLYRVAQHFSLGKYLRISEAEERNSGRVKKSLLSNSVEAILGAIYFDSDENVGVVQGFVTRVYEELFPHISLETMFRDFKTTLQEITQSQFGVIPEYKVISTSGPDHEKLFDIGVYIDGKIYGKASGKTKKSAEQSSAEQTILMLEEDTV
jgi:ribonuclease-3